MLLHQKAADHEFARQTRAEKALTLAQVNECRGAQMGLADRGVQRALPVLTYELGLLDRDQVVRLMRHVIKRCGPIRVGKFALHQWIGRGGMGIVFKGEQTSLKRAVAVKLLLRPQMTEQFIQKFKFESRISGRLRHQNLVAVIEAGETDGWHFLSMEYVDGPTLSQHVAAHGPMPEAEVAELGAKVAFALHHAHEHGIIHRDVKPGNIMLAPDGEPKLCDMGLAQSRGMDESEMARRGVTVGSRRYMAPEQVRGIAHIDHRADIYSLGLTLFFALTGKVPFHNIHKREVMARHLAGELHWVAGENLHISDAMSWAVMRMTAPEPSDRYNTALDLGNDLAALVKELKA